MPRNEKLIAAREMRGWSQVEAADKAKVSRVHYARLELGTITPRGSTVGLMCQAFHMSATDLGYPHFKYLGDQPPSVGEEPISTFALSNPASASYNVRESTSSTISETSSTEATSVGLPILYAHCLPLEMAADDCATWFGVKQAHIQKLINQWRGQASASDVLQALVDGELTMFNEMKQVFPQEAFTLSRRQTLIGIAMLPVVLLTPPQSGAVSKLAYEEFLPQCAASLTACWHLLRGQEFFAAEKVIARYLPVLTETAQHSPKYRTTAASLAAQGYRLLAIIALHQGNTTARGMYHNQSVVYSEIAENPGLFTVALLTVGHYNPNPVYATRVYQRCLPFLSKISPLLHSKLYSKLAVAHAKQGQEQEALRYLAQGQEAYPDQPENDPSFLYAEFSPTSLIMEGGRTHLALAQTLAQNQYVQQAWDIFARGVTSQGSPERVRVEVINYQTEVALVLQDREAFCHYLELGVQGAKTLQSDKRRQEAISSYKKAKLLWPDEPRIHALADVFL